MCLLHLDIAVYDMLDSALKAAQARHKYKLRAEAEGETVTWKANGEDDDDDAEEAIAEEQLERSSDNASGYRVASERITSCMITSDALTEGGSRRHVAVMSGAFEGL